ncbi:MAG: hypothetical protein CMP20_01790 [Rickettsiales bacterium]|nr:hypothetical protein [Rickettsiales bacterium]
MFDPYGRLVNKGRTARAQVVFQSIEELVASPGMTRDILMERLRVTFDLKDLVRAFAVSLFGLESFVQAYVRYVHTHYQTGTLFKSVPYADTAQDIFHAFACYPFNVSFQGNKFCLFQHPKDKDRMLVPIESEPGTQNISFLSMTLLRLFLVLDGTNEWFTKTETSFCGKQKFIDYVASFAQRKVWIEYLLTESVVMPFMRTTKRLDDNDEDMQLLIRTNNDNHQRCLFQCVLQQFESLEDQPILISREWVNEGVDLLSKICTAELKSDEFAIAFDSFMQLIALLHAD